MKRIDLFSSNRSERKGILKSKDKSVDKKQKNEVKFADLLGSFPMGSAAEEKRRK